MDLSRDLDEADGDALAPVFVAFCAGCRAKGYDAEAAAFAAINFGAHVMSQVKQSPLFTITLLEKVASQQLVDFHDLAVAEMAAVETAGSA